MQTYFCDKFCSLLCNRAVIAPQFYYPLRRHNQWWEEPLAEGDEARKKHMPAGLEYTTVELLCGVLASPAEDGVRSLLTWYMMMRAGNAISATAVASSVTANWVRR